MKPLVYLAGPYSNPDPVANTHRAIKLADAVRDVCTPFVPHLTLFWHVISPQPYEDWLALDLEYLARCDAVFRFPGDSAGADAEVAHAATLGIPIVYSEDELRSWAA